MKDNFDKVLELVFKHEGGYVNHPSDPGGETNFGISKRAYPNVDIKNLTKESASHLYHEDYWVPIHGDSLPSGIDVCMMDFAVNSGKKRAIRYAQELAGSQPDGVMGPNTLTDIKKYPGGTMAFINDYQDKRLSFLKQIRTWDTFGKGWARRVEETRSEAFKLL